MAAAKEVNGVVISGGLRWVIGIVCVIVTSLAAYTGNEIRLLRSDLQDFKMAVSDQFATVAVNQAVMVEKMNGQARNETAIQELRVEQDKLRVTNEELRRQIEALKTRP